MFHKVLVVNRGEIAVRIIRTCREMGVQSIALYEPPDIASLHVRLADEVLLLDHPDGWFARDEVVRLALQSGADAVHPGYSFLAERPDFIYACRRAGLKFIGPPVETVALIRDKVNALEIARKAGFPTVDSVSLDLQNLDLDAPTQQEAIRARARQLGYPLVIKPGGGGSGKGERLVACPDQLLPALRQTVAAAQAAFCPQCVYFERAIAPGHKITVPVLGDEYGHLLQLGESQSYLYPGNQKLFEETPAPFLDSAQRAAVQGAALDLACLFHLTGLTSLSFVVDPDGQHYFTEIKAYLPVEHPLFEMMHRIDLVREQIRLAAGLRLNLEQTRLKGAGAAMFCRVHAENPEHDFLPSPGRLLQARFPAGQEVRVDSYVYPGCEVPGRYDTLIAKLAVWDEDRPACLQRMRRALKEFKLSGIRTNLGLLKERLYAADLVNGCYAAPAQDRESGTETVKTDHPPRHDLAVIAGLLHQHRQLSIQPPSPPQTAKLRPPRRRPAGGSLT